MNKTSLALSLLLLNACGGAELFDLSPDYRQSQVGRHLELPPQLTAVAQQGLLVPEEERYSYQRAQEEALQQADGFLDVLPTLEGVSQEENRILIAEDANRVWAWTLLYFERAGIPLQQSDALDGVMLTQWLSDRRKEPQSGLGRLLSKVGLIGQEERDRYRLQFQRQGKQTLIEVQHRRLQEVERAQGKADIPDYQWQESASGDARLEQEMARRLALFLSQQRRR